MSMKLFELKQQREHALAKAEAILATAEHTQRHLTKEESLDVDNATAAVNALNAKIGAIESKNTIRGQFPTGMPIMDGARKFQMPHTVKLSADYADDFSPTSNPTASRSEPRFMKAAVVPRAAMPCQLLWMTKSCRSLPQR